MKNILFVLSVLFMMVVVGCSTPTTDNSVEETVIQTPANPQTPSAPVVDKSPYEYVKPACVNLADYTYVGDYIFADSMNFAEWKYSNSQTDYLLAFEKIARVKNDNPDTRIVRQNHYTLEYVNTTKATKYKIYAKTSVVGTLNIYDFVIRTINTGMEGTYDAGQISIRKESDTTFSISVMGDASTVLTDYVTY